MKRILVVRENDQSRNAPAIIAVFKARDGKWSYCPSLVRSWPSFSFQGEYQTVEQALEAAKADQTIPSGSVLNVEAA